MERFFNLEEISLNYVDYINVYMTEMILLDLVFVFIVLARFEICDIIYWMDVFEVTI